MIDYACYDHKVNHGSNEGNAICNNQLTNSSIVKKMTEVHQVNEAEGYPTSGADSQADELHRDV